ncbi:Hypothetical protein MIP_05067 [Mycobacterium intracellulare subsp. intracellulare MTCC 9506]|uniref:Lipoprotein n=1 Tax=Mycobacterium indicus pranii (strain DSM 45239 / MTCC 9506) TaxID=1232724 RepID=J9WDW6_MYCIP|nr:Hypothetical protein MIP_05067 [Mycobacterium intracellulare subsp. intracellulare MTCC 9506]
MTKRIALALILAFIPFTTSGCFAPICTPGTMPNCVFQ